eukprot:NODE_4370_length_810_cov_4.620237_g3623_i0.p4 GENE.NODE_4370_length_810_cov_4.620237_g3623_i0~~NODE_4370_length_810_cov_4.620237_g3623_i0.p4  ORF type:complete len:58 (-),score=2.67 NODE_4370_length_810_cov_4.620237_g3623_i0:253-426(-)
MSCHYNTPLLAISGQKWAAPGSSKSLIWRTLGWPSFGQKWPKLETGYFLQKYPAVGT